MSGRQKRKRPRPVSRVQCGETGKLQYEDYGDAVRVAVMRSRYAGPLRIYECPSCRSWHLTKRRNCDSPPAS